MVYLIGAGPGYAGLITVKGYNILKRCDAVIYDRLGTNELLEIVPDTCEKIYVGKKPGQHYRKQEEINRILIETAQKYETVVRLKGGDPFVFGRGGEEVTKLLEEQIPFFVIPGVTSAIAVPEMMGIPVTHRETSRSFHVFTGHTNVSCDSPFSYIKKEEGSSIFLMGISHLEGIVNRLLEEGTEKEKPVAVISKGSLPGETMVTGTLADIVDKVREKGITSPAVIVVGDTVSYHFVSDHIGSLQGKKIGVTGTYELREKMRAYVESKGARLYSLCSMDIKRLPAAREIKKELSVLDTYQWIVFTSANGIKLFFEEAKKCGFDFRKFAGVKFAVIGSGTRHTLSEYGFHADFCPEKYTTKALAEGLAGYALPGEHILIPRALQGSRELSMILEENGLSCKELPVYDVVGRRTENWKYLYDFDVLTFASSSGVRAFIKEIEQDMTIEEWEQERKKKNVIVSAIGEVTNKALKQYGITADVVPKQCDIKHQMEALQNFYR